VVPAFRGACRQSLRLLRRLDPDHQEGLRPPHPRRLRRCTGLKQPAWADRGRTSYVPATVKMTRNRTRQDATKVKQNQSDDPLQSRLHREGREFESLAAYQPSLALRASARQVRLLPSEGCRVIVVPLPLETGFELQCAMPPEQPVPSFLSNTPKRNAKRKAREHGPASRKHEQSFCRTARRPTFKSGATSVIGPCGNTPCGNAGKAAVAEAEFDDGVPLRREIR
jgi:hypothetical protein